MEEREFRKQLAIIQKEKFHYSGKNPFDYGMLRAAFQENQFQRLLVLAKQLHTGLGARKCAVWKREINRCQAIQKRFSKVLKEKAPEVSKIKPVPRRPDNSLEARLARIELKQKF